MKPQVPPQSSGLENFLYNSIHLAMVNNQGDRAIVSVIAIKTVGLPHLQVLVGFSDSLRAGRERLLGWHHWYR